MVWEIEYQNESGSRFMVEGSRGTVPYLKPWTSNGEPERLKVFLIGVLKIRGGRGSGKWCYGRLDFATRKAQVQW